MAVPKLRFPEFTDEWKIYKLKEISSYNTKRVSISADNYIGTENLKKNYGGIDNPIQSDDLVNGVKFNFGNILISNIRPYLKKIWYSNKFGCASSDVLVLNANQGESKFLYYTLAQDKFFDYMMTGAKGSKMPRGDKKHIMDYYFRLPSLPEQKKIADFLSAFDKRIETTQKKLTMLEKLKKGFMQKIFSQQLRFKDDNGNDYPAWEEKKIKDIAKIVGGGTPSTKHEEYYKGNIPWISSQDINEESIFQISKTRFITQDAIKHSSTKIIPPYSILIVSRVGTGKVAINFEQLCTSQDYTNLILCKDFNAIFIAYCIKTIMYKTKTQAQGTSIKGIPSSVLREMDLLIPSFPEQEKIADFLSAFDEKMDLVRKEVDTLQTIKKGLLQQMFV